MCWIGNYYWFITVIWIDFDVRKPEITEIYVAIYSKVAFSVNFPDRFKSKHFFPKIRNLWISVKSMWVYVIHITQKRWCTCLIYCFKSCQFLVQVGDWILWKVFIAHSLVDHVTYFVHLQFPTEK